MTHEPQPDATKRSVNVQIVNGFIRDGAGGNPAAVVLDADGLDETEMQAIATNAGLSETAFVSQSETEAFKLDFFTPNRRIAHCGHATIGTFSVLAAQGRVQEGWSSKETVDGPRAIRITEGAAFMEQMAPRYSDEPDWTDAAGGRCDKRDAEGAAVGDGVSGAGHWYWHLPPRGRAASLRRKNPSQSWVPWSAMGTRPALCRPWDWMATPRRSFTEAVVRASHSVFRRPRSAERTKLRFWSKR